MSIVFAFFCLASFEILHAKGENKVIIDKRCNIPDDEREYYSRYVNFRPGDGQIVHLNPPRFSWGYLPDVVPESTRVPNNQRFRLQISKTDDFSDIEIEVKDTPYNFYNTLPPFSGAEKWYWRVGYNVGTEDEKWSDVRSFVIHPNAKTWDRSKLAKPDLASIGHPRILFNSKNLEEIRALKDKNSECNRIAERIKNRADKIIHSDWWLNFPDSDRIPPDKIGRNYHSMARDMIMVAFAYILYQDEKYLGCKERFLKLASWDKGGYSSPEGALPEDANRYMGGPEDATQINEFLALFFDWFYNELSSSERETVIKSLEWRINHIVNSFSWKRDNGNRIHPNSIALISSSHQYEAFMDTLPACLALYEHSQIAKDAFDLGVNYLIGVTNGFGFEEGWNEGAGYGNSKMKWLLNATIYFDTAFGDVEFGKNPFYRAIGDFFIHITPAGLQHTSFGNGGLSKGRIHGNRIANFRKLAYLTGDGRFLKNRDQSRKMFTISYHRPWIEYILPHYYQKPQAYEEDTRTKLFKVAGWVTAVSKLPSSYEDYDEAVGMIFHCRPRGGYSHSFFNENAFDIHAYGEVITHGGGTTDNSDRYADETMSHNSILVDGKGQYQYGYYPLSKYGGYYHRAPHKRAGYIVAFDKGENYVYWVGDATNAYYESAPYLKRFRRHVLFVRDKYFIIFDELRTDLAHQPGRFYWLYHIYPDVSIEFDKEKLEFQYQIGKTRVKVKHIANSDDLLYEDRQGLDGLINPVTGEDYRKYGQDDRLFTHNIWINNSTPTNEFEFLAVIFPYKETETEPVITKLDDLTVKVEYGGFKDVISFDVNSTYSPDITVDYASIGMH